MSGQTYKDLEVTLRLEYLPRDAAGTSLQKLSRVGMMLNKLIKALKAKA